MARDVLFRERLVPGWWVFAAAFGFVAMIAIAYGAVLGAVLGWAVMVVGAACASGALLASSPVVLVDQHGLHAGPAVLPFEVMRAAEILDATQTQDARGPKSDPRWFTMLRPSRARQSVLVTVDDPADPHPAWLITSRRPHDLVAALG